MTDIATAPRMDPEMQTDMSSHSTNTPDMSIEERLLEQVTCSTQPLTDDSRPPADTAKTSAPKSSTTPSPSTFADMYFAGASILFCSLLISSGCVEPWLASYHVSLFSI